MTLPQLTQIQNGGERLKAMRQWQAEMANLVRALNAEAFDNGMVAAKSPDIIKTKKEAFNAIIDKLFDVNLVS